MPKCVDCQKLITAKPFTTHRDALSCAVCNESREEENKREMINLDRALELFPEMFHSEESRANRLVGIRPDLSMMHEPYERYVVTSFFDNDMAWVWVFDAETETEAKEKVKSDPKVKHYFNCEIIAMNACIAELNSKGQ